MRKKHLTKYSFILFIILFSVYYIAYPADVSKSCRIGVMLWFEQVFPVLFIFTVLSNLIISTNVLSGIPEKYILIIIYFLGCIFGFPIGARLASDFDAKGYINPRHIEYISAFSNHFSMPFIITYALTGQLGLSGHFGIYMAALYLPSMLGMIWLIAYADQPADIIYNKKQKIPASGFKLDMQIVDAGIVKGFETLIKLCGYIVLFSVIARVPKTLSVDSTALYIAGAFFEATCGIDVICGLNIMRTSQILLCIALLSFGGMSCIMQTKSIFAGKTFRLCKYILIKVIMTISSIVVMTALLGIFLRV